MLIYLTLLIIAKPAHTRQVYTFNTKNQIILYVQLIA